MTRLTHTATELLAMLIATVVAQPRGFALAPAPEAEPAQAEVQIGLCSPIDHIVHTLDLRPRGASIEVWQFDDAALTLFGRGLRLRLRVTAAGRSEFTLKVANQDCPRLDPKLVPPGEGKCEYDVYGASTAGTVSLNRSLSAKSTTDLLAGRLAPANVLSAAQLKYLQVVRIWPLPPGVRGLGPMQVQTYRTKGKRYDIDMSQLPDGEQYAEISRKVPLVDATRTMAVMEADLARAGVEKCADQSSQAVNKLRSLLH